MKATKLASTAVLLLVLLNVRMAYGGRAATYDETISSIRETMVGNTSDARKESYGYIKFDRCIMDYEVTGIYPVGGPYTIQYRGIDFSSLKYDRSKTGRDYTSFIVLNFERELRAKKSVQDVGIHTVVVNVSDDEKAEKLYQSFVYLAKLCFAPKKPL